MRIIVLAADDRVAKLHAVKSVRFLEILHIVLLFFRVRIIVLLAVFTAIFDAIFRVRARVF